VTIMAILSSLVCVSINTAGVNSEFPFGSLFFFRGFSRDMQDGCLIAHLHQPPQLLDLVDDEWRQEHLGHGARASHLPATYRVVPDQAMIVFCVLLSFPRRF
jgi:hypothetical protein